MNLFGRKKPAAAEATKAASDPQAIVATIGRLQEHQRTLEKRKELLQKQADKALADARERNKKGDKKGALLHLKRKKQAEKQMEQSYGMISNLEAQINALQSAALTKEHVDVVSLANRQLKAVQETVSPDKVDDVRADFEELMANHAEMTELLGQEWAPTPGLDDADLEAELEALDGEMLEEEVAAKPAKVATPAEAAAAAAAANAAAAAARSNAAISSLPAPPTGLPAAALPAPPTATPVIPRSMDDELAALEASI